MGKGGGGQVEVTEYSLSDHFGICAGPLDAITRIVVKEKTAWAGRATELGSFTIDMPELFGGVKKEGGVGGIVTFLPGAADQVMPDDLAQKLGRADGADCPGFRGLASAFFTGVGGIAGRAGFYWTANNPYLPGVWITVERAPVGLDPDIAMIGASGTAEGTSAVPQSGLWRYKVVAHLDAADYSAASYDDSAWLTGPQPFADLGWGGAAGTIVPTEHDYWLRRTLGPNIVGIRFDVDDYAEVWYNDTPLTLTRETYGGGLNGTYSASFPPGLIGEENIIAIRVNDTESGDDNHTDFQIVTGGDASASDIPFTPGSDANPAHIIYECLTNTDWGMGSPTLAIDTDSFNDAAQTLFDEAFGLSMLWTRQSSIESFVQEVLDHIQAVLYVDPATGLLTLTLIRGDYDPVSLPDINPDNADLTSFSRKLWGDIVNEITVTWTNPQNEQDETITVQDDASIATQGGTVSDSRNYYGVRNAALAQDLAMRDLRSAGQPLASCQAEVDRTQWRLRPASVVTVTWPEYGLSGVVMRVTSVDYGKPGDPTIKLDLIEDVYGIDIGDYESAPSSEWTDPSAWPVPITDVEIFTLPLFLAMGSPAAEFVATPEYPEVVAGVLATTDAADTFGYELWDEFTLPNGSTEWRKIVDGNIIGRAEIEAALDLEAVSTAVTFDTRGGQTFPTVGGFVIIGEDGEDGNEIAMIDAADYGAGEYELVRGVLDTVPRAWPVGTAVWFVDDSTLFEDSQVRSSGETVDYKLLTRTSRALLALDAATLESYTLTDRPWQPNRPADVQAYGEAWSSETAMIDAVARPDPWVTCTWANRNRLLEDSVVLAWTDGDVTPEVGQTTRIEVLAWDGTPLVTHDALTGTTFDVPDASFGSHELVRLQFYADRSDDDGDFASLQFFEHWVQVAPLTADTTIVTADTTYWTADEG